MNQKLKKNLVILGLATSLSASAALVPVLSSIKEAFPGWENWIQLLVTVPPLMIMVSSLSVSPLLKKFSDKQLTIFGLLLVIFSGVYPYFSNSFPLLLVSRIIMGLGLGLVTTISSSLPAGYFEIGEDRDTATGIQSAFSSFGGILFSFLSGWIASFYWKGVFLVQLLNLIPLIFVFLFMEANKSFEIEDSPIEESVQSGQVIVKEAFLLTFLAFLCVVITVTFPLNLSVFVAENNIGTTQLSGIITSVNSFMGFLIGLSFPKINSYFKNKTLSLSLFLVGISLLIISQANTALILLIGSTIFGIGTSFIYPSFLTTIYKEISDEKIVAAVAMYTVATNVAQFVSPFIVNNLANIFGGGIQTRFILCAIAIILLGLFILFYYSSRKQESY